MIELSSLTAWMSTLIGKIVIILFLFLLAGLVFRLSKRIANWLIGASRLGKKQRGMRPERRQTLQGLVAGAITFAALAIAALLALSLFFDSTTLIWIVGLFSAGFGLGARPMVSDFLSGIGFMFEDTFDVSEKIEIPGLPGGSVMGLVEAVHLRTTVIRAMSGEPYIVPNGEIRVVRNFSRGDFSEANVKIKLATADLGRALLLLEELNQEALSRLPNLLEPWQVISETGEMGQQTELTLVAKARFGKAGEMRPRLLTFVQDRLTEAGIELAS